MYLLKAGMYRKHKQARAGTQGGLAGIVNWQGKGRVLRSCRSLGKGACNRGTASQHSRSRMPPALRQAAEVDDWDGGAQGEDKGKRKSAPPAHGAGGKVAMWLWSTVAGSG